MFQDIHRRLDACEVGLSDVEILGHAADDSMILEQGEAEDIWKEIEARKAFIRRVKLMVREKKLRIYGLMVYSFMQRFDQLDKLLTNIEEGVTEEQKAIPDIQTALERMRNNEVKHISNAFKREFIFYESTLDISLGSENILFEV